MLTVNEIPKPGDCGFYVKRKKRFCENPATWTAEYGQAPPVKMPCCQLHAKTLHRTQNARVSRIMPIGDLTVDSRAEQPHCPQCGASTMFPVLKDGKPVCPYCESKPAAS